VFEQLRLNLPVGEFLALLLNRVSIDELLNGLTDSVLLVSLVIILDMIELKIIIINYL